ncbi:MAG: hypothetical protein RIE32_00890 [Phycisphaerales bacterium]
MTNGRIPKDDASFIDWSRIHADLWAGGGTPPVIGLDNLEIASFEEKTAAAEAAYTAMLAARQASRDATALKDATFAALRAEASADLARIDAFATTTGDPGVYPKAGIPAPKTPSERTAPPAPTDLRTTVDTDGSITLSFKATTGGGATYLVQRRTTSTEGLESPYVFLGFAEDDKTFVDNAVPEGVRSVGYRVAARLSTGPQSGWSVTRTVPFGSQSNQASSTQTAGSIEPVKSEDQKDAG